MFVDVVESNDAILCWYRIDEGLVFLKEPAPYYLYKIDDNGEHLSLFKEKLRRLDFETRHDFDNYRKKRRNLYESDILPTYKFLSDNFYGLDDTLINVGFFDIEVDYDLENGKGYPSVINPHGEINSISLYDRSKDEYHLVMLHEPLNIDYDESENVHLHFCVTERQVLDTFFRLIKDIDILSAWYGDGFDIPYIIERSRILYGESEGLKKLCRDGFKARSRTRFDDYGNEFIVYNLVGRLFIDYMELYKKFSFNERRSYSLDSIAEEELDEHKLEYTGDLGDLYRKNPKKFFEYSLHDARLLKKLDDKLKFMNQAIMMAKKATVKVNDIFSSIRYIEHSIMNYCHHERKERLILPDVDKRNKKEDFPGAYVIDTTPGSYGWSSSIDLASLYPSVIRTINISPETHILQCKNTRDDFTKVVEQSDEDIVLIDMYSGDEYVLKGFEVYQLLRDENLIISAYGSIFSHEYGLIPEIMDIWYAERKKMKKKSKEFYKAGDKVNGDYYDILQNLAKLSLNSTYGIISNPKSRFYSIYLAASVTTTGQIIEKYQTWKADQLIQEKVANGR